MQHIVENVLMDPKTSTTTLYTTSVPRWAVTTTVHAVPSSLMVICLEVTCSMDNSMNASLVFCPFGKILEAAYQMSWKRSLINKVVSEMLNSWITGSSDVTIVSIISFSSVHIRYLIQSLDQKYFCYHRKGQGLGRRDIHLLVGSSNGKLKRDITVSIYQLIFQNAFPGIIVSIKALVETIFDEADAARFLVDGSYCADKDSRSGYYNFRPSEVHGSKSPPGRFLTKVLRVSQMTYCQILHLLVSLTWKLRFYQK